MRQEDCRFKANLDYKETVGQFFFDKSMVNLSKQLEEIVSITLIDRDNIR